jgi:hypothetical protein
VFGVSKTFGIGGVAVRDMDEGEVRGDASFCWRSSASARAAASGF